MINNVEFSLFLIDIASWQQEDEKCSNHYFQENKSDLPMDFFIFSLSGFCHDYNHLYIYIYIYKTEAFAGTTIFHVSTIFKK